MMFKNMLIHASLLAMCLASGALCAANPSTGGVPDQTQTASRFEGSTPSVYESPSFQVGAPAQGPTAANCATKKTPLELALCQCIKTTPLGQIGTCIDSYQFDVP